MTTRPTPPHSGSVGGTPELNHAGLKRAALVLRCIGNSNPTLGVLCDEGLSKWLVKDIVTAYKSYESDAAHWKGKKRMNKANTAPDTHSLLKEGVMEGVRPFKSEITSSPEQVVSTIREALEGLAKLSLDVMQDDVAPYGATLNCGWVLEQCKNTLALLPQLEAMLAKEPVHLEEVAIDAFETFSDVDSTEMAKAYARAVLDCAGVPYAE